MIAPRRQVEELLILTKTYPSPSAKHRETTCVAALNRNGEMRRVFPVPFRFLDGEHQFQRWEWIRAILTKARDDQRPESYKIDVDTIQKLNERIDTRNGWEERKRWVEPHISEGFAALEVRRQTVGHTLGILRPTRLIRLEISAVRETEWTEEEKVKLTQEGLFDSEEVRSRATLRKMPFDFYYVYECDGKDGVEERRHKIVDWEAGALYWNCFRNHGKNWEEPFRKKLEGEFAEKDLMFLMGTIHRFPDQWLIVGLIYPPKLEPKQEDQLSLAL